MTQLLFVLAVVSAWLILSMVVALVLAAVIRRAEAHEHPMRRVVGAEIRRASR